MKVTLRHSGDLTCATRAPWAAIIPAKAGIHSASFRRSARSEPLRLRDQQRAHAA